MKTIISLIALFSTALISGCMGNLGGGGLGAMTPEQIKASAAIKDASVSCSTGQTIYGKFTSVWVNVSQKVVDNGGVAVSQDCGSISFNNSKAVPPAGSTTTTTVTMPAK